MCYQLDLPCWCSSMVPSILSRSPLAHRMWVSQVGDFGLRMTGPAGSSVILPVDISLSGASYLCIIGAPNRQPPYRIDNRQAAPVALQPCIVNRCRWSCCCVALHHCSLMLTFVSLFPVDRCQHFKVRAAVMTLLKDAVVCSRLLETSQTCICSYPLTVPLTATCAVVIAGQVSASSWH